jgi:Ca2+-binding EF-hand superfamily protein
LSESSHWCKLEVQEAFDVFDKEKSGVITIPQFKRVINRIGEKLTDSEIDQQYFQFDMNNDNALDINGFSKAAISDSKTF